MIDFPITELVDDRICLMWLERHLHPDGLACPPCHRLERRLFRSQGDFPADRCRLCDGDDTLLTHTVVEKTRQRPATLVLSRTQLHTLRQRLQAHLHDTAPTGVMSGTACEADERDQHAGEPTHAPSRSRRPAPSARPSAPRARHLCP